MRKKKFLLQIQITLVGAFLAVCALGVASFQSIEALLKASTERSQIEKVMTQFDMTIAALKQVESDLSNYIQKGTPEARQAWELNRQTYLDQQKLLFSNALQLAEFSELKLIFASRRALALEVVKARTQSVDEALAILNGPQFESLRKQTADLLTLARQRGQSALAEKDQAAKKAALLVEDLIVGVGIVLLILLSWIIFIISHYERARSRLTSELRRSAAFSRSVTEGIVEGVVSIDGTNVILQANRAALKLFGYDGRSMIGINFLDLISRANRPSFDEFEALVADKELDETFHIGDHEICCLKSDGTAFLGCVSVSRVVVDGSSVRTALIHDITQREEAAASLRESQVMLQSITDTVPALIAYHNEKQEFLFSNKVYFEIFGKGKSQLQGCRLSQVLPMDVYSLLEPYINEVLRGYPVHFELELTDIRGEHRTFAMEYSPHYSNESSAAPVIGFYSLGTDITALKRIDTMKTEFISTVSHELRTPLTSIRGSLGLISGGLGGALPEKMKSLVDIAKNNSDRLIRLINDILDSEKIESGKMELDMQKHDLKQVIRDIVAFNLGFALQHGVGLVFNPTEGSFNSGIDSDRFNQALTNLVSNAIKFSPPAGSVQITLEASGAQLKVSVSDQGPGIPDEFKKRIFQKFSQADGSSTRKVGGTGLGLNISKALIEKMGGSVGFTSVANQGSTFFIILPQWQEPAS